MMKKLLFLFTSVLLAMNVVAQQGIWLRSADRAECNFSDYQQLRATFSFSSITAEEVATVQGLFSRLSMPNTVIGGNEGDPQIPVVNELIAVPFGAQPTIRVTSYSTTDYQLSDQGIHTLMPRQPSLRKDQKPEEQPFVYNAAAYQTRGLHSEPRAVVNVVGTMRGIQLGKMTIEPVSYDPVGNILRVFNDIEVEVSFDGANAQAAKQMLVDTYSPYFNAIYKQMFNGRAILDAYDEFPDLYTTPVKMLVVTTTKYANSDSFSSWLSWKKQKGIDVDVQLVTPNTPATDVRSLIQSRYNANHPTFLIIIGDEKDVTNYSIYTEEGLNHNPYVTDNEYASMDDDVYHDMLMSRIPVSTVAEFDNVVNKTLMYEKYTMPDPTYLDNVMFIAGEDAEGGNHITYGIPAVNYATRNYFNTEHGFSNVYKYDNPNSNNNTGCYSNLNSGVGFTYFTGHGAINAVGYPTFTTNLVSQLTNTDQYFWFMACCCLTANWGYPDDPSSNAICLGEALLRSEVGAFGYIGSLLETTWQEDYYFSLGATNVTGRVPQQAETATGVYDGMFMDDCWNTLNSICFLGKVAVTYAHAGDYLYFSTDEHYWRGYQCLGDGSVMPYQSTPEVNNVSHISNVLTGTSSLTVTADAGSYVSITFDDEILGVAQVPASGTVDIPIVGMNTPGSAMIVVTRQQRQPYIGTITVEGVGEQYDITCNPTEHGTISVQAQAYPGAFVTMTANPDAGYCLDSWEVRDANNNLISVSGNKFVMPECNVTVGATFVPAYTVILASVMYGNISADPVFAKQGTTITLTADPEYGYELSSWIVFKADDMNTTVEVNDNSFILPDYDVIMSAIFLPPHEVTIGSGTTTNYTLPVTANYEYSTSQQIYTYDEIGMAGTITAISFNYKGTTSSGQRNINIYLSHTNRYALYTAWIAQETTNLVYSGTQTFTPGWCTITLDTPFEYDGESNLLLTVDDNTGYVSGYSRMYFYTYPASSYGENRATYNYHERFNVDPVNPQSGTSYKPTASTSNNQVIFTMGLPGSLSISSNALSVFAYAIDEGPSAAQSLAVIGANLQGDLTITAPSCYEICQTETGDYTATLTLSPTDGSLQTMVYVRLASGLDEGIYYGTMTIASANATAEVILNGEVTTGTSPLVSYTFTGATSTSWNEASNWLGNEVPVEGASVIIDGLCELDVDANVASLSVNAGKSITVLNGKTLTSQVITTTDASQLVVAQGGQLMGNVGGVLATIQRVIDGFGSDMSVTNGWNFIASPLEGSMVHTDVANLTNNSYDLFAFDQTGGGEQLEWRNFKVESDGLALNSGNGYLYANSDDVTLSFAGQLNSSVTSVELVYESGHEFSGWNLIGNPFTYDVFINKPHYVMDEGVLNPNPVTASSPIVPCSGAMVKVDGQETLNFSQMIPDRSNQGSLHMVLSQSNHRGAASDHVILSFNEGDNLAKYRFGDNATLYFPKDGEDLAIMTAENCGEVPVCFKANENGSFKFDFSIEDVDFGYLHLIDNITGDNVDLLVNPSYTFNAKTTDYASRFKLVFATGLASDGSFAFFSNDGWVINNEEKATLQVIDIKGRILSSENISGCCVKSLTVASGVYMLRLINGNSVKTQKIIVD